MEIDERLLAASKSNASALRNREVAYTQIGQTHEVLAKRSAVPDRKREWREARAWYQRSLDLWVELKKEGMLIPGYAPRVGEATRNVANCDRELGDK